MYVQKDNLVAGEVYPIPQLQDFSNILGKGGFGEVIRFPLCGKSYAVKVVSTRLYACVSKKCVRHGVFYCDSRTFKLLVEYYYCPISIGSPSVLCRPFKLVL